VDLSCPKCGFTVAEGSLDCPRCGIVFARYRPRQAAADEVPPPAPGVPPPPPSDAAGEPAYRSVEEIQAELSALRGEAPGPAPRAAVNPYRAPSASLGAVDFLPRGETELASRWARLLAVILDTLIPMGLMFAVVLPLTVVGAAIGGGEDPTMPIHPAFFSVILIVFAVSVIGYLVYMLRMMATEGQTPGKKIMKVRVVRSDGSPVGLARYFFLRGLIPGLLGAIPIFGTIFALVNVLFIFTEERRCIHDHLADTIVVVA
jgi:uncharacterized RDD family membrane protein YckC